MSWLFGLLLANHNRAFRVLRFAFRSWGHRLAFGPRRIRAQTMLILSHVAEFAGAVDQLPLPFLLLFHWRGLVREPVNHPRQPSL